MASFAVCLFAGCKIGEMNADEFLKNNNAENQCVTYFANGGRFNNNAVRTKLDVYYQANSYIVCSDTENFRIARTDFIFDGWYYITVDGNGNPVCDADGNVILGEKVKPTDKIGENKHLYVAAGWSTDVVITVKLVTEDGFEVEDKDGNKYKNGDEIKTLNFGVFSEYGLEGSYYAIENAVNATYLYFFADEDCTKPITSVKKPTDSEVKSVEVYAKYIKGEWNIVSTASDVRNMFNNSSVTSRCTNYYLFSTNGSGVIDYANQTLSVGLSNSTFAINIEGNGVIIDNIKFSRAGSNALTGGKNSILGRLGASSSIKNLTLRNVKFTADAGRNNPEICVVCNGYEDGAKSENFVNFNIQTVTAELSAASGTMIYNIQNNNTDCWLYGAFGEVTDAQFMQIFTGIKVTGATLKVGGTTLV